MTSPLIKFSLISSKLDRCHVSLDLRRHQYVERNLVAIFWFLLDLQLICDLLLNRCKAARILSVKCYR